MISKWQKVTAPAPQQYVEIGHGVIYELGTTSDLVALTPQVFTDFAAFLIDDANPIVLSVGTNVTF